MAFIINAIVTILLVYFGCKYAFASGMTVSHPFENGIKGQCGNDMSFLLFSVMTSMVFLGPLSLVKYAIWIGFLVLMSRRWTKKWDSVMTMYLIFILWNLYTMTYTPYPFQGWMMIVKFCLPIL